MEDYPQSIKEKIKKWMSKKSLSEYFSVDDRGQYTFYPSMMALHGYYVTDKQRKNIELYLCLKMGAIMFLMLWAPSVPEEYHFLYSYVLMACCACYFVAKKVLHKFIGTLSMNPALQKITFNHYFSIIFFTVAVFFLWAWMGYLSGMMFTDITASDVWAWRHILLFSFSMSAVATIIMFSDIRNFMKLRAAHRLAP